MKSSVAFIGNLEKVKSPLGRSAFSPKSLSKDQYEGMPGCWFIVHHFYLLSFTLPKKMMWLPIDTLLACPWQIRIVEWNTTADVAVWSVYWIL